MARAMSASGDLNPKAIPVMSRTLVLTDSVRPLDRPCSMTARIDGVCVTMGFLQLHECRDPASAGAAPAVQGLTSLVDGHLEGEDRPRTLFDAAEPAGLSAAGHGWRSHPYGGIDAPDTHATVIRAGETDK
jgi:hypothetical protein